MSLNCSLICEKNVDIYDDENKFIFFIHDTSKLKYESDDPIKAVIYFHPENVQDNYSCWLSNSIVCLSASVQSITKFQPQNFHFENKVFTLKKFEKISFVFGCCKGILKPTEICLYLDFIIQSLILVF